MRIEELSTYQHALARIRARWPAFLTRRGARLAEQVRYGHAAERATECILEDLFTEVLDWEVGDLNHQVGFADLTLTRTSIKWLIVEAKRPGALAWNEAAVRAALDQACRYAAEQHVLHVAVSDGIMLYAADVVDGGIRDRVFVSLAQPVAPEDLWWLAVMAINRPRQDPGKAALRLLPKPGTSAQPPLTAAAGAELLHPKYHVPARCFAYVGNAAHTSTWKLPYRLLDGTPDHGRLPKAIQSILSNYRGAKVRGIPDAAVPDVLRRLAQAASELGRLPSQMSDPAFIYVDLVNALKQFAPADRDPAPGDAG